MNKQELIKAVAKKSNKKYEDIKQIIENTILVMEETFINNEEISINNFGSFVLLTRKETKERTQWSPIINKMITIPSKNESLKLSFKSSKKLEEKINDGK